MTDISKLPTLLEVLMCRDSMSKEAAQEMIDEAKARVADGENPEEILYEDFGVEPDFIFDLFD